ncbi:MAG: L,D-transpeptidase/peptidoglycan binding protein [Kineothrix sp.]|nr:L,D-transpeptidase/peptidoglycan binding protein [Kineothrix sp.]
MKGKRKKGKWKKWLIAVFLPLLILMIATYVCISLYFENHYFYHTVIGGEDVSYKTPMEVEEMLYARIYHYSLEITGREGITDTILPEKINMRFLIDDTLVQIKHEQNPRLWILGFFKEYDYAFPWNITYDEEAFSQELDNLAFFQAKNIKKPKAAYLTYSKEEKQYMVTEAEPGTEILQDKTEEVVRDALVSMETKLDLEEKGCYKVKKEDGIDEGLASARDEANQYVQSCITYRWNGNEVVVDGDIIHKWVKVEGDEVSLDEDSVKEFVSEQAKKYDTYGKNRIFQTTDGREIELKSGAYGWKTDSEAEGEELVKSIKKGEQTEREPANSYTAAKPGDKDIGDTYVEIDLGKQHLYLYVEGELILESDFVSGNASRGWNTPAGVFGLTYKTTNAVLRGENYATPVSYWMPFNGNIGMHDATWRNSFGGEIYLTNGSHGCINLPYENAKVIYEYVYTGFPIVCYY